MSNQLIQIGNASFSKSNRLRRKRDFLYVKTRARKYYSRFMVVQIVDALDGNSRLGVIASKRFDKLAVERNRARRIVKESFRLLKSAIFQPIWIVIIVKKQIHHQTTRTIQKELAGILLSANVFLESSVISE